MDAIAMKFGGTCTATNESATQVLNVVFDVSQQNSVIIVPSASGKRWPDGTRGNDDTKITNDLYLWCDHMLAGKSTDARLLRNKIVQRHLDILGTSSTKLDLPGLFDNRAAHFEHIRNKDHFVSMGEYMMGTILAKALNCPLINPLDIFFFSPNGSIDWEKTQTAIRSKLGYLKTGEHPSRVVVPGFYGLSSDGHIRLLPRGGSDISAALIAAALMIELQIWKTVDGISTANPDIVPEALTIDACSHTDMYEISSNGAQVIHPQAVSWCGKRKVPIHVYDLSKPHVVGTKIVEFPANTKTPVLSIVHQPNITAITVVKHDIEDEVGFLNALLDVFRREGISVDYPPTSINLASILFRDKTGKVLAIESAIRKLFEPDEIHTEVLDMVTVVGRYVPGGRVDSRIIDTLDKAEIPRLTVIRPPKSQSISLGVPFDMGKAAVRALHREFFEKYEE